MMVAAVSFRRRYCGVTLLLLLCLLLFVQYSSVNQLDLSDQLAIGWEFNRSRNATEYVLPEDMTALISSSTVCASTYPPHILLVVCSSTENFELRVAVRKTWAYLAHEKFNISVAFLMGVSQDKQINESIRKESDAYGDVIVEDFMDTYNNLTIKTLMLLKWVKNNCNHTNYVMKTDDDVYINMKNVALFVESAQETNSNGLLCGRLLCDSKPINDPTNKWYVPRYLYSSELYPNYLAGFAYLISTNIALSLYEEAFSVPMLHMEDVFLTGICARRLGIKPSRHTMFYVRVAGTLECSAEDDYLIILGHGVKTEEMYSIHKTQQACQSKPKRSLFDWLFHPSIAARRRFDPTVSLRGPAAYSYSCET